jgi:hypothetical protein
VDAEIYVPFLVTEQSVSGIDFCNCAVVLDSCYVASALYLNETHDDISRHFFVGLFGSCVPLVGFLRSTIGWWYNGTRIQQIQQTYAIAINSTSPRPAIESLDAYVYTRFLQSTTNDLLKEMFVETWITNNSHFALFYNQCAPISCSYSIDKRRDVVIALLLLIAMCSGLNRSLQLLVPLAVRIVSLLIGKWKNRGQAQRK